MPPYVLFLTRITPEVLAYWHQNKATHPEGTVYVASGLDGYNGEWVREEAKNGGVAQEFLDVVKKLDIKVYGEAADALRQLWNEVLYERAPLARFVPEYDNWAVSKCDRILKAVADARMPTHPSWDVFEVNVNKRVQMLRDVDIAVNEGKDAREIFQRSQQEFKITDTSCLSLEGHAPFMQRLCGFDSELVQLLSKVLDFSLFRALTKNPLSSKGSCADMAAVAWLTTFNLDHVRTVSCAELEEKLPLIRDTMRKAVLQHDSWKGNFEYRAEIKNQLPLEVYQDNEIDDCAAWDYLCYLSRGKIHRIQFVHPEVAGDDDFSPTHECGHALILSTGVSEKNQRLALQRYSTCNGCDIRTMELEDEYIGAH